MAVEINPDLGDAPPKSAAATQGVIPKIQVISGFFLMFNSW